MLPPPRQPRRTNTRLPLLLGQEERLKRRFRVGGSIGSIESGESTESIESIESGESGESGESIESCESGELGGHSGGGLGSAVMSL